MNIKENNNQSSQQHLCEGCYEFYGNPANENLCSKCYRSRKQEVEQAKKPAVELDLNHIQGSSSTDGSEVSSRKESHDTRMEEEKALTNDLAQKQE